MKKLIGVLVSMSMVVSLSVPAFAAPEAFVSTDPDEELSIAAEEADIAAEETDPAVAEIDTVQPEAAEETAKVQYIDDLSLELSYDDRYDLSELGEGISSDEQYVIYKTEYAQGQGITSYQVSQGKNTGVADEALLAFQEASNTEVIATGVGSGTVWLVRADQEEDLRKALEENPSGGNSGETIDVYEIAVTVEPATLTLMFLTGQSNMEGYCDSYTGYSLGNSIACEEGAVYSTYVPRDTSRGKDITGIDFNAVCTTGNYKTTAGNFVPGSLQGAVTNKGTVGNPLNMAGGTLEYPLDSLTATGSGKTGPDSGLAYEWHRQTGDKVWTVNTAYGATNISGWVPGGSYYDRSAVIWENVLKTYQAELDAGHYNAGSKLVFWQQGSTGDADYADGTALDPEEYEAYFGTMYNAMSNALDMDALGIIMVRAGYATNRGTDYRDENDLLMTGPRIAQYYLGSGNSSYDNVYVVSNANEQWVSNSGVKSYFQGQYGSTFTYPVQSGSASLPTTVSAVHYDIHYSQLGHNENGITAANGMLGALNNASVGSISWRNGNGQTVSSMTLELSMDTAIAVPVADPVYTAKQMSAAPASGRVLTYDVMNGLVGAVSLSTSGTENLVASAGGKTGNLSVTISVPNDLSKIAGADYTGLYKYDGIWWYLKNGVIQPDYEGVVKNENGWWYVKDGQVDFSYTGFAENSNGWWYIEDGKVTFTKTDVIKDTNAKIDGAQTWWYVDGSKVQFDYTGFAQNSNGWWYIEKGKVTFAKTDVIKDTNKKIDGAQSWWYVDGSKVQFNYTGFAQNSNGKWYIESGKVAFSKNDVLKDTTGAIGSAGTWYYVLGSKVQTSFTGLADYKNSNGWWYIKDGKVDFSANTVAKNKNGWYYITGGKVDFSYNGFGSNNNGKWYCEGGKVTFAQNNVLKDTTGAIGTKGTWYYVVGSKVQTSFTGLANYKNENGWWYIKDGKVDFSHNGVDKNINGWYYVTGGKVRFDFTGLANYKNANGWWYIQNGRVDFSHSGVDKNVNGWWYMENGKVIFSFNGIARNSNGWWYIQDGKVDFSFSGTVTVSGITYSVTNGRVAR